MLLFDTAGWTVIVKLFYILQNKEVNTIVTAVVAALLDVLNADDSAQLSMHAHLLGT